MKESEKKHKIKAIIFDLGGVVMHGGFLPFIQNYCKTCFTPEGQKKIKQLERDVNKGDISEEEFYHQMQEVFDVHLTPKQMHDAIIEKMTVDKDLLEYIPKLHESKVALFTNSIGHISEEVLKKRHIPVKKLFDKVFVSSKMHIVKPDQEAYEAIVDELDVEPSEALMVDDRQVNIDGAKKAGLHGIVYKNADQFKKDLKNFELIHED